MPDENQNQQNLIEATIERLVRARMYEGIVLDEQTALREQVTEEVEDCVKDVLLQALSDEQLEDLDRRLDAGMTDKEEQEYFLNVGVDYRPLLEQALVKLGEDGGRA